MKSISFPPPRGRFLKALICEEPRVCAGNSFATLSWMKTQNSRMTLKTSVKMILGDATGDGVKNATTTVSGNLQDTN